MATRGVAAPEVEQTYVRIQALAHQVEESPRGLWLFYSMRGEIETAREFGAQLMDFAQRRHDASLLFEAHMVLGMTMFLVFPFTRLVHVWSGFAALAYVMRPYQVARSRRLGVPAGHLTLAGQARAPATKPAAEPAAMDYPVPAREARA